MTKTTILIVEDEAIVAADLAGKLRQLGYEVVGTETKGEEAVESACRLKPEVVMMDIRLKGAMDGIEAAKAILRRHCAPVIYLTAHSDEATLERAKLSQPYGYIVKPFEERELSTTIELALYKHRSDMQLREQREWLRVTLTSIGDAVITCDTDGLVTFLNPVAEALTGWSIDDARERPIGEVFRLINEQTRQPYEGPVALVLREGRAKALANHTALVTRDGRDISVEDSAAPIMDADGRVIGVVLVFHDVTEKRRAQEALRDSEQRFRLATETTGVGIWEWNVLTNRIRWDAQMFRIYGITPSKDGFVQYSDWSEAVLPEELPKQEKILNNTARHGGQSSREFRIRRREDGEIRDIQAIETVRTNAQGQIEWVVGTNLDITERKQSEKTRAALAAIVESSEDAVIGKTLDGTITSWNSGAEHLFGYRADEIIGQSIIHIIPPELQDEESVILDRLRQGQPITHYETERLDKDGRRIPISLSISSIRDDSGVIIGVSKIARDNSERKQTMEALIQQEERLRMALEAAKMAAWDWHVPSGDVIWNEMHYRMMGYEPGEVQPSYQAWASRVHPDDVETVQKRIQECMAEGTVYTAEFRTRWPDGTVRWLEARGETDYNTENEPLRQYGVMIDITERRQAEEALKQLNAALEERVAQRTGELAATVDNLRVEINERKHAEEKVQRLNRLYAVISETNQAIIRTKDKETIFNDFCRIAVEDGKFILAWTGLLDEESGALKIVAAHGATGYLDNIRITANEEPAGIGPTGRAVREGTYCICNDFLGSPLTSPWHERGRTYGIRASASIAMRQEGQVIGTLTLYADTKDFFDQLQIELLRQMGMDISFALDTIVRETRRKEAERALRDETVERMRATEALREKEQLLIQQSRQAAMGEMIGNIAHQWRQPLNVLGLNIQQLMLYYDLDEFSREFLENSVNKSMEVIQHMSRTIDDFRNFFKPDKESAEFKVNGAITSTLALVEESFKNDAIGIDVITKDDAVINGYKNEYAQVVLNILNNARDVLLERGINDRKVIITLGAAGDKSVVTIADNAGGIPGEIIDKIFDPYFTTKGLQTGTGVGLFMSKTIIEKNMKGRLTARNIAGGAEFRIEV